MDIKRDELRKNIAIVLQDTVLFSDTIENNIKYANLEASDEAMVKAAEMSNIRKYIERQPKKYKTFLKQAATIIVVRYIMAAGFAALFYFVLPFAQEVRQVLAIVCFSPNSAMTPAFTEKLKSNAALSSFVGSVSIVISVFIITLLIGYMGLN